jgi:hypothetical protein
MDIINLALPEISNGDIEVGIASGVDDIDEPYSILRICNPHRAHAVLKGTFGVCKPL